ncbi:MAG: CCA tRNA nucleotidyltransferase, partial [Pikeienuella sp.]
LAALDARGESRALRLSRAAGGRLRAIRDARARPEPPAIRAYRHGAEAARDAILIEAAAGAPLPDRWREEISRGAAASPPVTAVDLMEMGYEPGPALGLMLKKIEIRWIATDLRATRAQLIARDI